MPSEKIGQYEIEYEGVHLADGEGWGAQLTIFGASHNPMHRNSLFPQQRVSPELVFQSEAEAASEARRVGVEMVESGSHHPDRNKSY